MVLINKPLGLSSQHVVTRAKRLTGAKKAGHTGTLDPMASGLLPVCLNEATKFAGYLLTSDKHYRATLKLGCTTDTGDCEGQILSTHAGPLPSPEQVMAVLPRFIGEQDQTPPRYSALKFQGRKYYEYAREGIEIERPSRRITIFSIECNELALPHITIDVHCSSGTYIRTLAEDIGQALGCGATLSALCRTSIGKWALDSALSLDHLAEPYSIALQSHPAIISSEDMLHHLPVCILNTEEVQALYCGKRIAHRLETNGLYRLFHDMMGARICIGLGKIESQELVSQRLFAQHAIHS